jgi:hypothetical protein
MMELQAFCHLRTDHPPPRYSRVPFFPENTFQREGPQILLLNLPRDPDFPQQARKVRIPSRPLGEIPP